MTTIEILTLTKIHTIYVNKYLNKLTQNPLDPSKP